MLRAIGSILLVFALFALAAVRFMLPLVQGRIACRS